MTPSFLGKKNFSLNNFLYFLAITLIFSKRFVSDHFDIGGK